MQRRGHWNSGFGFKQSIINLPYFYSVYNGLSYLNLGTITPLSPPLRGWGGSLIPSPLRERGFIFVDKLKLRENVLYFKFLI
jgi:hypothetical protein